MPILKRTLTNLRFISSKRSEIDWKKLNFQTKVPQSVVKSQFSEKTVRVKITEEEMNLLERLSLVDLDRKEAVKVLEDSIEFASKIQNIDTNNVEPLYTVLEKNPLELREDKVTEVKIKQEIMRNAKKTYEETYFVSPVGNITLK